MTDNKINTTTAPFEGMTASEILTTLDKDSTANTIETALNAVKDKLADSNKTARENRISELFELVTNDGDKTRFFVEYLASPYYTAQTIAGPDSEGQYSMKPAARFLDYCALEKAYRKRMDKKGTLYASPDYADRMTALIKALFAYKSKDVGAVDGKTAPSITALQNAAQAVADAIFPAAMKIHARRCDVRYMIDCAFKASNAEYKQGSDAALRKAMIQAFGVSYAGETYAVNGSKTALAKPEDKKAEDKKASK